MAKRQNPLDATDLTLLTTLQADANRRLEDLAKLVGLAPSSVHDRLRRLERDGIIRQWTVEVDPVALGLDVLAFIGVRATKPCSELAPALAAIPAIEESHSVAGGLSLLLKVRVNSTAALLAFTDRLRQIPGIVGTETTVVLKTQFERPPALPGGKEKG
jgi:DNA-binding Lrp family transcriptional regulator